MPEVHQAVLDQVRSAGGFVSEFSPETSQRHGLPVSASRTQPSAHHPYGDSAGPDDENTSCIDWNMGAASSRPPKTQTSAAAAM
jgi:hypothetical protein